MTPEQERWAEALAIERIHGADASAWIDDRIAALAEQGEAAGVRRFQEIRARLEQVVAGPASPHARS